MKVNVAREVQTEIQVSPGMAYNVGRKSMNYVRKVVTVRRMVETKYGVYAVFSDDTWRPLTTYNKTWWRA